MCRVGLSHISTIRARLLSQEPQAHHKYIRLFTASTYGGKASN